MPVNSRRKGATFERWVVRRIREVMPGVDIKRGLQFRDGAEAPDVDMPVFHVECKVGAQQSPRAALAQANRDAKPDKVPIAVVKDDRKEPFVILSFENFLKFIKEWWVIPM
jgi:hypothetical protein